MGNASIKFHLTERRAGTVAPPLPVWELDEPHWKERVQIPQPDNQAALLTLQSRRLLLIREDDVVTGYTALGGDFFEEETFLRADDHLEKDGRKEKHTFRIRPAAP